MRRFHWADRLRPLAIPPLVVAVTMSAVVASCALSGCSMTGGGQRWFRPRRQVLKPDATLDEIVTELNRNVLGDGARPGLAAWRSDHVKVSFGMMPMLAGTLAVEAPRNLRLQFNLPVGGQIADLGSNGHEYWWWTKDQQTLAVGQHGEVMTRDLPFPLPFEPEWLLDVFGVTPVSDEGVTLTRLGPKTDAVELVSDAVSSDGSPVTRVRRVRLSTGETLSHEIRSNNGTTIARAEVVQHIRDPNSGVVLPQKVHVDWPSIGVNFTLHIAGHEVNPQRITASTFTTPNRPDWPIARITQPGTALPRRSIAPVSPSTTPVPASTVLPVRHHEPAATLSIDSF